MQDNVSAQTHMCSFAVVSCNTGMVTPCDSANSIAGGSKLQETQVHNSGGPGNFSKLSCRWCQVVLTQVVQTQAQQTQRIYRSQIGAFELFFCQAFAPIFLRSRSVSACCSCMLFSRHSYKPLRFPCSDAFFILSFFSLLMFHVSRWCVVTFVFH